MGVSDLLFPKYCIGCKKLGSYLCDTCFSYISFSTKTMCLACGKPTILGLTHPKCRGKYVIDGCFVSLTYQGIVKKLVYQLKYKPYLATLHPILVDFLYEGVIQQIGFINTYEKYKTKSIVTAIPLHRTKLRKRGYNHAALLGKAFAQKIGIESADLLIRTRETASQFGLKKEAREKNMRDAFFYTGGTVKRDTVVFVVDDIVTTGSTLLEAARVLKKAGFLAVFGVTLAAEE